ncbi:NAD(P)-binding protein [Punctularia strigosozonata HHB-11173 SS5]|uniref:NAD(P)-binding protein n=1 Tax=Punctularia strigosozonata (strain HHB-11173) TaxID=741275 RepID=UPI000441673F|nr:NAD(P)-binding protein [Punctularia strigosozonata HHB-11173 SS5]EIN08886.1 NAD(P)-binding protein [Punctularia strigosozonata HHB-11173 SS5]
MDLSNWHIVVACILVVLLYIVYNDRKLLALPEEARIHSPTRITAQSALEAAKDLVDDPVRIEHYLPPATGRRYIVIGGAGFLGGWIVRHLIERGEDPHKIRVLDIRAPTRPDLISGAATLVDFYQVDISNAESVKRAFSAPWPEHALDAPLTVFHSAANIRFYERSPELFSLSAAVNVRGTQNIIDAARQCDASILVYTSSGSITFHTTRCLLWPWEKQPERVVQLLDDKSPIPLKHEEFFSNYAASKTIAEGLVRSADKTPSGTGVLRTGCIRPGNGIYGTGGDALCGALLVRKSNQTWMGNVLHSFVYVENCSLAHLNYERCLIEIEKASQRGSGNDEHKSDVTDIGGDAFTICDSGPAVTYGDVYTLLQTLTAGTTTFTTVSPTAMLLLAHLVEFYYLLRHRLIKSTSAVSRLAGRCLPSVKGDILGLQPSAFPFTLSHLIFSDSRARLPLSSGGLGYRGPYTTSKGLCKLVEEYERSGRRAEERSLTLGLGMDVAPRATLAADLGGKVKRIGQSLAEEAVGLAN